MASCKIVIQDEVNCKCIGLDLDTRKALVKKFKYEDPSARFRPSYRLGRWDGAISFFGIGGTTYMYLLPQILEYLESRNYYIEVEDLRDSPMLEFEKITDNFWEGRTWPKGHIAEGQPIMLREYQVDIVNKFLENPQCLQEIATSAGKSICTATMAKICEKYGRTILIVPNKSLVEQTEEDYVNCGLDVGVYYGDRKDLNKTHTICTWQSLSILDKKSADPDAVLTLAEFLEGVCAVIVDECFSENNKVLTSSGYVAIKDIKPGDQIINYSEKTNNFKLDTVLARHINLTNSSSEKMYKLQFDNGSEIEVTGNHKFLTETGWCRADELTEFHKIINKT